MCCRRPCELAGKLGASRATVPYAVSIKTINSDLTNSLKTEPRNIDLKTSMVETLQTMDTVFPSVPEGNTASQTRTDSMGTMVLRHAVQDVRARRRQRRDAIRSVQQDHEQEHCGIDQGGARVLLYKGETS